MTPAESRGWPADRGGHTFKKPPSRGALQKPCPAFGNRGMVRQRTSRYGAFMSTSLPAAIAPSPRAAGDGAREKMLGHASNELVFGVVGHVGSGTSTVATQIADQLRHAGGAGFDVEVIKASTLILRANEPKTTARPTGSIEHASHLQDLGDRMRIEREEPAAVAVAVVREIQSRRKDKQGDAGDTEAGSLPDGTRRAWVVDSLRHPAEAELLRHIYQDAFVLVGVVCQENQREDRLREKFENDGSKAKVQKFMERDAKDGHSPLGQRVADTFHMSDFFVDNTEDRDKDGLANREWDVPDHLGRLVKIVTHSEIVRPTAAETAMHVAYGAQLRSACLSRQVGAALYSDDFSALLSTGTNEVPRAGGGVYGLDRDGEHDHRCAFRADEARRFCSNTRHQVELVKELVDTLSQVSAEAGVELPRELVQLTLPDALRRTRVGGLLEFSRAVHAEMDALLGAARSGTSTVGTRLFVTTFPCHYCARHIVSAGVTEVQYIEPYPKSLALQLHDDAIAVAPQNSGGRVVFRPFCGVAPRLYRRAFLKDRDLKSNANGALKIGQPEWGTPWHLRRVSYVTLESELLAEHQESGDAQDR